MRAFPSFRPGGLILSAKDGAGGSLFAVAPWSMTRPNRKEPMPPEEWRPIPGATAYEVSSHGRVRRSGKLLKLKTDKHGYVKVALSLGKKKSYRYAQVHRLMCEAFFGQPPSPKHQAAHGNGVRVANFIWNLRWATVKENVADKFLHGFIPPHGSKHHGAKLDEQKVVEIRARLRDGERGVELAIEYGVSKATISEVKHGKMWKHVDETLADC